MPAAHLRGQSGAGMLPPLSVFFRVERMSIVGKGRVWLMVGDDHTVREFASQAADKLRAQGFTVRVRPVIA